MNKILRFSLVAVMTLLLHAVSAKDVVILPSDFTPATSADYTTVKDGVTVAVTASTVTAEQMRIFKNQSIAIVSTTGENVTKVVFTCAAEGEAKYGPGCFSAVTGSYSYEGKEGTWTGSSMQVVLTAATNQVRATQIVVTLGEGGTTPDDPINPGDDGDDDDGLLSQFKIASGSISESDTQVLFDFTGTVNEVSVSGNIVFSFDKELCTGSTASFTFPSAEIAQVFYQDLQAHGEEDGYTSVTIEGTKITALTNEFNDHSKICIKSMMKLLLDKEEIGVGTLESPFSPNMANVIAGMQEKGVSSSDDYFVKGKIASIKYEFSAQYGTATFFISSDGKDDYTFQCYSVYYLENKSWVEGNTQIKIGDEVIVCGKFVNYNGVTPETVSKKAYLYSLNGVTKNESSQEPQQDIIKIATIAEFNAAEESTSVWYQLTGTVKNLKDNDQYGNFYLEDATDSVYVYGLLSEKGGAKKLFQELAAAKGIKNGSKITIIGNRGSYKDKIEVLNAYFVSIEDDTEAVGTLEVARQYYGRVYNMRGQMVSPAYKGLVIKNGKKYVNK